MPSYAGPPVAHRPGEGASALRLLAYLALGIALIFLDHRGGWMMRVREQAALLGQPVWWVAGLPARVGTRLQDDAVTRGHLSAENQRLRNELMIANARLTRLQTAIADNTQLRALLGVARSRGVDVQLAPVLNIDLDPTRQRLVLAAGSRQGVTPGQPVIDAGGLLGQIIQVTPTTSTVLLLTDPDHAVPVMLSRNGVRLVAYGNGRSDQLELVNIPLNSDIQEGDLVVTSGLGGRFPAGFPVGTVLHLRADDSRAFLLAELKPAAHLDRGRSVLLLKNGRTTAPAPASASGAGTAGGGTGIPVAIGAQPHAPPAPTAASVPPPAATGAARTPPGPARAAGATPPTGTAPGARNLDPGAAPAPARAAPMPERPR